MRRLQVLVVVGLGAFCGAVLAGGGGVPAEPGGMAPREVPTVIPERVAEDGQPYAAGPAEDTGTGIHPELQEAALTGDPVDVFLLLRTPEGSGAPNATAVKASHMPRIRELGEELRAIELRYRPQGRFSREEERGLEQVPPALSDEDRALRRRLQEEADGRKDAMRRAVADALAARVGGAQEAVARYVERLGGEVRARVITGNVLDVRILGHLLPELADHPLVVGVVPRHEGAPALSQTPTIAGFGTWYTNGFDGGVFDAGVADTGVQQNHPAFAGITFYNNTGTVVDSADHGTHVAGIIGSGHGTYRGTAFGLDALIWGYAGGSAFVTMDWAVTSAGQAPEVFNMSWAYGMASDVDYNYEDRWFDVYIDYYDVLIAFAAANSGWSDTTPTAHHPAVGYNSITVANMNSWGNTNRLDDVRAADSSVGPTLGGRRKPDIAAPGSFIRSTNARWSGTNALGGFCGSAELNDYCYLGGTSMASPHVAGGIVLLHEGGVLDAMAQKAILINTADWWTSNNTSGTGDDGPVNVAASTASQWDKSYGWGYLDMDHAYTHRTDYFLSSVIPRNDNAVEDDYKLFAGHLDAGERATLVWHRRGLRGAGWPTDKYDSSVFALSDLNVRLYSESNGSLLGADLAGGDTVHQVHALSAQDVVVKVYAWSSSFDGASSEPFALATEEGFQAVNFPDTFQGLASWPATMQPNEEADIIFWIRNDSSAASHQNTFDLILPAGWARVSGADPANVGSAPGGSGFSGSITWRVRAPATEGPYTITSQHTHSSYDESYGPFNWNMGITVVTDVTPPTPNPMSWLVEPYEVNTTQIQMIATTASDPHGPVEYYHDYTGSPTGGSGGSDSGWITSTTFIDSALFANHEYCYRIWARDNPLTTPNNTTPSASSCDYTDIQTPTGITFGTIATGSIQARSTNTPSNLTLGSSGLMIQNVTVGDNSGWQQNNNYWTSLGLTPNSAYSFRAYARNGDASTTPFSPTSVRYTLANPPAAIPLEVMDDTTIRASWSANGNPSGTEYLAENLSNGTNSGWITSTFWDSTGLVCGNTYSLRVRARNGDLFQTALVSLGSLTAGFNFDGDALPDCLDPDDDNDGAADGFDCLPFDPVAWASASEARDLLLSHAAGTTVLSWSAPLAPGTTGTVFYDTAVTGSAGLWGSADASCVEHDDGDTNAAHTSDPGAGQVLFFLTRPQNRCGNGDEGAGADVPGGAPIPRDMRDCGCVHARCDVGAPLAAGCDPCVATICGADPYCCRTAWDSICVDEVLTYCGITCS